MLTVGHVGHSLQGRWLRNQRDSVMKPIRYVCYSPWFGAFGNGMIGEARRSIKFHLAERAVVYWFWFLGKCKVVQESRVIIRGYRAMASQATAY